MLKFGHTYIIDPLCKLFNNILSTGKFPVVWAKGIIVLIFKSGEKCYKWVSKINVTSMMLALWCNAKP
jgi:hypothetical protein